MRIPRKYSLPAGCLFHFMWRAINGEFFLATDDLKRIFLDRFFKFIGVAGGAVLVYAFAAMSNHFHKAGGLLRDASPLSRWARSAHASFALWLNRRLNRRGPVAQDRPKTVIAQSQESLKRIMFYIDWNPVKAGMCGHPSEYEFSSYRYYAFGEVNSWTRYLTPPKWYLESGRTPEERQARYREDCDRYYREELLPTDDEADGGRAYGAPEFVKRQTVLMKALGKHLAKRTLTRKSLDYLVELLFRFESIERTATACNGPSQTSTIPVPAG